MKSFSCSIILLLLLTSCNSGIKYLGNSYPATTDVKIYFKESDIKEDFELIGKIYLDVEEKTKDEKIQKMIVDKAKKHGGDAIILGDLQTVRSGSVSGTAGGSTRVGKGGVVGGSTKKSKNTNNVRIEAQVLKFDQSSK